MKFTLYSSTCSSPYWCCLRSFLHYFHSHRMRFRNQRLYFVQCCFRNRRLCSAQRCSHNRLKRFRTLRLCSVRCCRFHNLLTRAWTSPKSLSALPCTLSLLLYPSPP